MAVKKSNIPLVVDLDGTLVKTDLLLESALCLLRQNPLFFFKMIWWALQKGRAHLKSQIAQRVTIDVTRLPYNRNVIAYATKEKESRPVVLATATHKKFATAIQKHLGLFDAVFASDTDNLSSTAKAERLVREYGSGKFDYIGNSTADIPVWRVARRILVVDATAFLARVLTKRGQKIYKTFSQKPSPITSFFKALRPHHWSKNILIFLPVLADPEAIEKISLMQLATAFISFSLCSSSVYLLNDMLDIEHDRHHETKKNRPFAAGLLPLTYGIIATPLLLVGSVLLALQISTTYTAILVLYYVLTLSYSFYLKHQILLDVFCLSLLYTLRIVAGAAIVIQPPSFWLFVFSVCLFFSLALVKRYSELANTSQKLRGRGYITNDIPMLRSMGIASGFAACLVLSLYIASDIVRARYDAPEMLWGSCFILFYWISRLWFLANRGLVNEDPIVFAFKDKNSCITIALALIFVVFASAGF